jgi:hypothetical protein
MIRQKLPYCLPEPRRDDKAGDGLPEFMMRDIEAPAQAFVGGPTKSAWIFCLYIIFSENREDTFRSDA